MTDGMIIFSFDPCQPGTYDLLAHLHIHPPPPPLPTTLSNGSPLIDIHSGAVVGVLAARRVDAGVLSTKEVGWGVPSERIFEGFRLPGMGGKT